MASSMTPFVARLLEYLRIVPRQGHGSVVFAVRRVNQIWAAVTASLQSAWSSGTCRPVPIGVRCLRCRQRELNENYAETRRAGRPLAPRQDDQPDQELNIVATYA